MPHGECYNGTCHCAPGYGGVDCATPLCPSGCSGHGACVEQQCVCDEGWASDDCSVRGCAGGCNGHGICVDGTCHCEDGYSGASCGVACARQFDVFLKAGVRPSAEPFEPPPGALAVPACSSAMGRRLLRFLE